MWIKFSLRSISLGDIYKEIKMSDEMTKKKKDMNVTLSAVIAMMYLLYKVNMLTNKHIKTMLKNIETDKEPLTILKELKDIASTVNDK